MNEKWYSETEHRLGMMPLDGKVLVTVSGTMEAVDKALTNLLRLWGITPASSIGWDSLGRPEEGDPTKATLLMEVKDAEAELRKVRAAKPRDPKHGPTHDDEAGQPAA